MTYDVAVIGGGIAGMAAASFLAERADVALLEAESALGYHATGRSAALYTECYGPGVIPKLTMASRAFFTEGPEPLAQPRGLLFVGTEDQSATTKALVDRFSPAVAGLEVLDGEGVRRLCPAIATAPGISGIYEPGALDLDVHGTLMRYRAMSRSHDAQILLQHRIHTIERSGTWHLISDAGSIDARILVNAGGAWGDHVANMAKVPPLSLRPLKRSAFLTAGTDSSPEWPMVVDVDERWYLKPEGPNLLGSAASEIPTEPADARPDDLDIALAIDRINEATSLGIRSVTSTWAGLRTFTPDRVPAVGPAVDDPSFIWLVGQGGYGIKTSPAMGRAAAALILDGELPDELRSFGITAESLSPGRFS